MFTGIVEEVGTVRRVGGGTLSIDAEEILTDVRLGDSIAVNGVCLTVTSFDKNHFEADVMPETVRRTSLAELRKGSLVNLERALKVGERYSPETPMTRHLALVDSIRRVSPSTWILNAS